MEAVAQLVRSVGPARLAAMGAVAAALMGFFAFLILRFSAPVMVPLYTDLAFDDSSAIVRELESRNAPYSLERDGGTIMVAQEDVLRLRMDLAGSGLPSGGGVGYEIFDRSDTLGATSFVQNINHLRALEGELSRTIRSLDRVASARVHLVIPERELFSRQAQQPSASIVLTTRGTMEPSHIRSIQHLIAAAVQGLEPGRVSVVDDSGRLLADGRGAEELGSSVMLDERQHSVENRLRQQIEDIVASVVGRDRVRVQVAAELNFDKVTQTSDVYDPESRVVRSTQTREENSSSSEAAQDAVTVGNELPDANLGAQGATAQETSTSAEEVVNYEISRTTRTEVTEAGQVRRLSVAVVVDGTYSQDGSGDVLYEPREQAQLDQIAALVRSAAGFDESRGDTVEVANLRFAHAPQELPAPAEDSFLPTLTRADLMRFAELGVLGILGLLVILVVARPLVRRVLTDAAPAAQLPAPAPGAPDTPQIAGPDEPGLALPSTAASEALQLAHIAGEVQASSLKKVGELIHNNPNEAVTIIRNWIHEPA